MNLEDKDSSHESFFATGIVLKIQTYIFVAPKRWLPFPLHLRNIKPLFEFF